MTPTQTPVAAPGFDGSRYENEDGPVTRPREEPVVGVGRRAGQRQFYGRRGLVAVRDGSHRRHYAIRPGEP